MFSIFKKLIFILIVFWIVGTALNLKLGDRPMRDWTQDAWENDTVQSVYTTVRDRIMAILNKDISVDDAFKSNPTAKKKDTDSVVPLKNMRDVNLEKLDEEDRQALERILKKAE